MPPFDTIISPLPGRYPHRTLLLGSGGLLMSLCLISVVLLALRHQPRADGVRYRLLTTVNYGTVTLDQMPISDWLFTPIQVPPGSHTLVLHAAPFTVACTLSLPRASDDDCLIDPVRQTLTLAPTALQLIPSLLYAAQIAWVFSASDDVGTPGQLYRRSPTDLTVTGIVGSTDQLRSNYFLTNVNVIDINWGDVPGASTEYALRDDRVRRLTTCPAYPLCPATPTIPDASSAESWWVSIPIMLAFTQDVPGESVTLVRTIQRIEVPLHYAATGWDVAAAPITTRRDDLLCHAFVAQFQQMLIDRYVQPPVPVLRTSTPCQGMLGAGRFTVNHGVVYLDIIAHQQFPEFPKFTQQVQP